MKKLLPLFVIIFGIHFHSSAQNYRLWASYYGGSDFDAAENITTDVFGNVYITGETASLTGIASGGAYQTANGGGYDAYVVKFNQFGVRQWATYFGGTGSDYSYGVKTDGVGNVYITGYTSSQNGIATPGAYQTNFNGVTEAFLAKFSPTGSLLWGTYYGGSDYEEAVALALDPLGNIYITGYTQSTNVFSSPGAHQSSNAGSTDAFLAKFDPSGNRLWGTFYGGIDDDYAADVAVDIFGNVFISGSSPSVSGIATAGGFQNSNAGFADAFLVKFNSTGVRQWGTYYGGTASDEGDGIVIGNGGSVFMTGRTMSASGIASGGYQNTLGGPDDAYLVKFNSSGIRLWATYYGGAGSEEGYDVTVDGYDNVFIGGDTYSPNVSNCIATAGAFQTTLIGSENHFLASFTTNGIRLSATYYGQVHEEEAHVAVTTSGGVYLSGFTHANTGIATPGSHQSTYGGNPEDGFLVKFSSSVPDTGIVVNNQFFVPTATTTPVIISGTSIFIGGGISLTTITLKNITPATPLPIGGTVTLTIRGDMFATFSSTSQNTPVTCPAILVVKITYNSTLGSTSIYEIELLSCDLSGGTLPGGIIFRESPTLISRGQIVSTTIGSGLYRMSAYFEPNMEVSTNSGADWSPSSSPSYIYMRSDSPSSIPTLGAWALITLSVLMAGFGISLVKKA